jgi:hypothetical protein
MEIYFHSTIRPHAVVLMHRDNFNFAVSIALYNGLFRVGTLFFASLQNANSLSGQWKASKQKFSILKHRAKNNEKGTLRDEHRLKVFENWMLNRISLSGPKREDVKRSWRK